MTFRNQMRDDLDIFFNEDEFGIPATYHVGSSESKDITIISDVTEDTDAIFSQIQLKKEDVEEPNRDQTVSFFGDTWRIHQILSGDDFVWNVLVSKCQKVMGKK